MLPLVPFEAVPVGPTRVVVVKVLVLVECPEVTVEVPVKVTVEFGASEELELMTTIGVKVEVGLDEVGEMV